MSSAQEKIDCLIALYRNAASYPNEKTQAYKALVRLCAKHNLNIEDVLREEQRVERYTMRCKNELEAEVFAQTVFRYAEPVMVGHTYQGRNYIGFECTPAKYVELMAAWSVLKLAWRDEQEVFKLEFFSANRLFGKRGDTQEQPELTEEEERQRMRAAAMATFVKKVEVHKQLGSGSV